MTADRSLALQSERSVDVFSFVVRSPVCFRAPIRDLIRR
jgi:hypothetical protein